jgi:hypothetical protein
METIKVRRETLLGKLTSNRERHIADYTAAMLGYQKAALLELDRGRRKLEEDPAYRVLLTELPPQNHAEDYGRAIRMLEWSVDELVPISHDDFARYVDDDWDWRASWTMNNAKYLGRR